MKSFKLLSYKQHQIIKDCMIDCYVCLDREEIPTLIGMDSDRLCDIFMGWAQYDFLPDADIAVYNCLNVLLNYPGVTSNADNKNLDTYSRKELEQILAQLNGDQIVPPLYDSDSLIEYLERGNQLEYVFFWNQIKDAAGIQADCLSQWYPAFFAVENIIYPSAEHYMMAEKARLFYDQDTLAKILTSESPRQAKMLGRHVKNFDETLWQQHRGAIVFKGNLAKFSQNHALKAFLLSTKNKVLVEASPLDTIWGIGLSADDVKALDPRNWQGLNLLGFELMRVRDAL